jgi:hypothetical protein
VTRNGTVLGAMGPRSGLPSVYRLCLLWGIRLGMMDSFKWNVSRPLFIVLALFTRLMVTMTDKDSLANWEDIVRTLLFDETWLMSAQWLPSAWCYGEVSCKHSQTIRRILKRRKITHISSSPPKSHDLTTHTFLSSYPNWTDGTSQRFRDVFLDVRSRAASVQEGSQGAHRVVRAFEVLPS